MERRQRQHVPTYNKSLFLDAPGARRPRLPITEQAIQEVLFAQPNMQMLAAELAALFVARTVAERERLTLATSRVAELVKTPAGNMVRLRSPEAASCGAGPRISDGNGQKKRPINSEAIRELLQQRPQQQMELADLRAWFNPCSAAERHALVVAISEATHIVRQSGNGAQGPIVRLKPPTTRMPECRVESSDGGLLSNHSSHEGVRKEGTRTRHRGGTSAPSSAEDGIPVTSMERELVRKLIQGAPSGSLRSDELVRMLSADSEQVPHCSIACNWAYSSFKRASRPMLPQDLSAHSRGRC